VVSTLEVNLGSNGARIWRSVSKLTPRKNLWALISSAPPRPRRLSVLQTRLEAMVSLGIKVWVRVLRTFGSDFQPLVPVECHPGSKGIGAS